MPTFRPNVCPRLRQSRGCVPAPLERRVAMSSGSDEPLPDSAESGNVGRRQFLGRLSAVGAAVSAGLVAVPVLRAILPPAATRRSSGDWVKVADDTALLDIGVPIRVNFVQSVEDAWVESR